MPVEDSFNNLTDIPIYMANEDANFLRFSHELVAKKFHTLAIVNGILFSAFNVLNTQVRESEYLMERATLVLIGLFFSSLWLFNIGRSLRYTKLFKKNVNIVNIKSINEFEYIGMFSSGGIVAIGTVAQIILWGILLGYVFTPHFLLELIFVGVILLGACIFLWIIRKRKVNKAINRDAAKRGF